MGKTGKKKSLSQVRLSEEVNWTTRYIALLRSNKTLTVTIHSGVDQSSLSTNLK